jgi:hypothetical protein
MGCKRKNTADRTTPPSSSRGRRPMAAPTAALNPAAVGAPPPPGSSAMVPYDQPEDGGRLLALGFGAVAVSAAEEEVLEVVRLRESNMPKPLLSCRQCHVSLKAPIFQVTRT